MIVLKNNPQDEESHENLKISAKTYLKLVALETDQVEANKKSVIEREVLLAHMKETQLAFEKLGDLSGELLSVREKYKTEEKQVLKDRENCIQRN